ncbi:hypothetical protein [Nocardia sp. R7R-8]|uniref:hypothetical protein n=1 Tax=Nocardia sp. R7R-8 TaxID=3459304 RepID=UPI00403E0FC4
MTGLNLDGIEIRAAYYCLSEMMRHRRRAGLPIPDSVRRLYDKLDWEIRFGTEPSFSPVAEIPDAIGTDEAARILCMSKRYVRQIASDFDGVRISGTWHFSRRAVEEYANMQRKHRRRN